MTPHYFRNIRDGTWAVLAGVALCAAGPLGTSAADTQETVAAPSTNAPAAEAEGNGTEAASAAPAEAGGGLVKLHRHRSHGNGEPVVAFGQNVEVREGETKQAVVVIGGSARVRG